MYFVIRRNTRKDGISGQMDLMTGGVVTVAYGESLEMEGLYERYVPAVTTYLNNFVSKGDR